MPQPVAYLPLSQYEQSDTILVVRSRRTPGQMAPVLARALGGLDPNAPITL